MLEIGTTIDGKYKILNQIGQGGMSIVYLAMNEKANRQWAVKEVRREGVLQFETVRQALAMEISLLKRLRHPNLPQIVDVIDREGAFLIVMDYIEGKPLSNLLECDGAQPQKQVVEWAKQLCDVLSYLHSWEPAVIYRDLKPANIMLQPEGTIKLIDFGAAREYRDDRNGDTRCLGTKGYAAPEQFGGLGQTDQRTDIYCLGTTLYHLLTGHNPCEPPYELQPIRHWNPALSEGMEKIIHKCTENDPEKRYQSCEEVLYALEHVEELEEKHKKKQAMILIFYMLLVCMTIGLGLASFSFYQKEHTLKVENYQAYMEEAREAGDIEEQQDRYRKAIELEPDRAEAYLQMIEQTFLTDDILTEEESEKLRMLLLQRDRNGVTYEERLKTNQSGYEQFAYRLGLAYFYTYEESGNKALASRWLLIASQATALEEGQRNRAMRLSKIAKYYSQIGIVNKAGDLEMSYAAYWEDLCQVSDGDIVREDNQTTAWMIYQEMIYQIYIHTSQFQQAGVSKDALRQQLDLIETRIEEDFQAEGFGNEICYENRVKEMNGNLERAKQVIENTYDHKR